VSFVFVLIAKFVYEILTFAYKSPNSTLRWDLFYLWPLLRFLPEINVSLLEKSKFHVAAGISANLICRHVTYLLDVYLKTLSLVLVLGPMLKSVLGLRPCLILARKFLISKYFMFTRILPIQCAYTAIDNVYLLIQIW